MNGPVRDRTLNGPACKLTVHFGERQRVAGRFAADALLDLFERRRISLSVLLRGVEGFGSKHSRRSSHLLTLSEDLPMVAVAVDREDVIRECAEAAAAICRRGLITVEPVVLGRPGGVAGEIKVTLFAGRHARNGARAAHLEIVDALHRSRVAGASTFLGVDGTVQGRRRRARFFSANRDVPTITVAVGAPDAIGRALDSVEASNPEAVAAFEPVTVVRRDGSEVVAAPPPVPPAADGGPASLPRPAAPGHRTVTVYCSEQSRHAGAPLYPQLVRGLRESGAAGATALRGIWGYHGDHLPHGDHDWSLRRRVPVAVTATDRLDRLEPMLGLAAAMTDETGLVTVEELPEVFRPEPAGRARAPTMRP